MSTQPRPNILIFMTDQQQAQVVAPNHPCHMPNVRRFAGQGVRFSHACCPTAHCCPSRATFFTGLYPSQHGVWNNVSTPTALSSGLKPGVTCFSEHLRKAGYELAFSGKWHISATENPADRGWKELMVTAGSSAQMQLSPAAYREARYATASHDRRPGQIVRPGWGDVQLYGTLPDGDFEQMSDVRVVDAAVRALPDLAGSGRPWCLYIGTFGPHDPFKAPKRFVDLYDPDLIELPASFADTMVDKPYVYQRVRRQYWDQLSEHEVREAIAHYWACNTMQDELFGNVLTALDRTGQADNTLVLFMSDHGEYAGAHGLWGKGVPSFREAYEIPLIARWPSGIAAPGRVAEELVTLADFAPTFCELAGADDAQLTAGRSLVPLLANNPTSGWPTTHFTQFNGVELYYTQRSVVTDRWKYVYNGFDRDELYDLKADMHETTNLASRSEHVDVMRSLIEQMWGFAEAQGDEFIFNNYMTVALCPYGPGSRYGPRQ